MKIPPEIFVPLANAIMDFYDPTVLEYEKQNDKKSSVLYFAYGSTMYQKCLENKVGQVDFVCKAVLNDFKIHFSRPQFGCSSRATLLPEPNSFVEGSVYKITKAQLSLLDEGKGRCFASRRIRLYVKKDIFGPSIPVEVHVLDFAQGDHYYPPSRDYLQSMLAGAKSIDVSEQYLTYLHVLALSINSRRSKL